MNVQNITNIVVTFNWSVITLQRSLHRGHVYFVNFDLNSVLEENIIP